MFTYEMKLTRRTINGEIIYNLNHVFFDGIRVRDREARVLCRASVRARERRIFLTFYYERRPFIKRSSITNRESTTDNIDATLLPTTRKKIFITAKKRTNIL